MMTGLKIQVCILLTVFCTGAFADVIAWPTDEEWNPITVGGDVLSDSVGDLSKKTLKKRPNLDIVGGNDGSGTVFAAGYLNLIDDAATSQTIDQLAIRLRISDISKRRMRGAYQVYFDLDNDLSVDFVLQLKVNDLEQNKGNVKLIAVSGTGPNDMTFGETLWRGSFKDHAQWTGEATSDGSQFGGNDDYFLDFGIGWDTFSQNTGVTTNDNFQIVVAASKRANRLKGGDIAGTDKFKNFTFSNEVYSDNIPEPAVFTLVLAFGGGMIMVRRIFGR